MPIATAAGTPDLVDLKHVPEIFSATMLEEYYASGVIPAICNTQFEGEIKKKGSVVNVPVMPTFIIRNHERNADIEIQDLDPSTTSFDVDKAKYIAFKLDSVNEHQTHIPLMSEWGQGAADAMKEDLDEVGLSELVGDAHANNIGLTAGIKTGAYNMGAAASPLQLTKTNICDTIVAAGSVLDEQKVPETGRILVLPPLFTGMLKLSDLKDASMTGDGESILRNGRLGVIDRFEIFKSPFVPSTTDTTITFSCLFGHRNAMTYASQFTEKAVADLGTKGFGKFFKSLYVYGVHGMQTKGIGYFYARQG